MNEISVKEICKTEINRLTFFPTSDFSLLESCQLYVVAKYEVSDCFKTSSHPEVFWEKGVLENLEKFTGKLLCQSLRPATLIKKRLWRRWGFFDIAKFLSFLIFKFLTFFFVEHVRWLTLVNLDPSL